MGYRENLSKMGIGVGRLASLRGDARLMRDTYRERTGMDIPSGSALHEVVQAKELGVEPNAALQDERIKKRVEALNPGKTIGWKE